MKADRTVILFGALLFLLGAAAAWNGYGYVQVERGWTLVISGTVAFCSGLILIALGLVLRQLEAIASSTAKSALFLAKAKSSGLLLSEPAPAPAPEAVEAPAAATVAQAEEEAEEEDAYAPLAPETENAPVAETAPAFPPPWVVQREEEERSQAAAAAPPKPPAWMSRAGSYVSTFAAPRAAESAPEPEKPAAEPDQDWLERAIADETARLGEEQAEPVSEPDVERAPAEQTAFWSKTESWAVEERVWSEPEAQTDADALLETAEGSEPEAPSSPEYEPEPAIAQDKPREDARGGDPEAEAESPEPSTEPSPERSTLPRPAIIGSYDAHGTHYTMYADGSIDAETAHGVYRFASMDELKRFIEKAE